MKKHDFAIIGGDKRISYVAQILSQKGYSVICYGVLDAERSSNLSIANSLKEVLYGSMVIICGIPFTKNGFLYFSDEVCPPISDDQILNHSSKEKQFSQNKITLQEVQRFLRKNQTLYAGMIPLDFRRICEDRQITCYDFMTDESLIMQNAVLTAEGALLEAFLHKDTGLHQSKILITGYGRCGMVLADKCLGLHGNVTVCDPLNKNLAQAAALGLSTITLEELPKRIDEFEYLFNTAPARVYTRELLQAMHPESLLVDIASGQVGVDYDAADSLNRKVLYCPGLPGKYAPLTCARQMTEYILSH